MTFVTYAQNVIGLFHEYRSFLSNSVACFWKNPVLYLLLYIFFPPEPSTVSTQNRHSINICCIKLSWLTLNYATIIAQKQKALSPCRTIPSLLVKIIQPRSCKYSLNTTIYNTLSLFKMKKIQDRGDQLERNQFCTEIHHLWQQTGKFTPNT